MNIDESRINVTLNEKPYILVAAEEYEEYMKKWKEEHEHE